MTNLTMAEQLAELNIAPEVVIPIVVTDKGHADDDATSEVAIPIVVTDREIIALSFEQQAINDLLDDIQTIIYDEYGKLPDNKKSDLNNMRTDLEILLAGRIILKAALRSKPKAISPYDHLRTVADGDLADNVAKYSDPGDEHHVVMLTLAQKHHDEFVSKISMMEKDSIL
jgi:hypothetical protein